MANNRQDLTEAGRAMGPLAEIARQVKEGKLTAAQLQDVVEGRNPFEDPRALKIYLTFWPNDSSDSYEAPFSGSEMQFNFPIHLQLPIGSRVSFTTDDHESVSVRVVRYFWEFPEDKLFLQVKADAEYMEARPNTFAQHIRKYWVY